MGMPSLRSHVLTLLTTHVRLATTLQLMDFNGEPTAKVNRCLDSMQRRGWLESAVAAVRQPTMVSPIFAWQIEHPTPNFNSLAYKLDSRWSSCEPKRCHLYWATPLAVEEFGGVGGTIRQPLQIEHDLAVSEVFFQLGQPAGWKMEDLFAENEFGTKVPDAIVSDNSGTIRVIEIGGQYSTARLEAFHIAMERLNLPYELW